MICTTCTHYRPTLGRHGRCALHRADVRHDHRCGEHDEAERETIEEWIARHGNPVRLRGVDGIDFERVISRGSWTDQHRGRK